VDLGGGRKGVWEGVGREFGRESEFGFRVRERGRMSYEPSYGYQQPSGRDGYGNATYERYAPDYAYEAPTGRDSYGNATYDASSQESYGGTNEG
jgi:hypothetical protein